MPLDRESRLPDPPARPADGHKGTFGRVLIIGGSRGMSGAPCLSGLAALRGGAGLVAVAVPAGIVPIVAGVEPSYMTIPLPEDEEGRIAFDAWRTLRPHVERADAVAIGPGLGTSDGLRSLVQWLLETSAGPLVVDADGLNALSLLPALWEERSAGDSATRPAWVLTPHPGEFARLTGRPAPSAPNEREQAAAEFAASRRVVLLLKGRHSIVTDGTRLAVNQTGNSGMGTGGTGDILTGLIASLLAQGMTAFDAAQLGSHLHGLAGDLAAAELSEPGLIASDLPRYLGRAWLKLSSTTAAGTP